MNSHVLFKQFGATAVGRFAAAGLQGLSLVFLARSVEPGQFGFVSALVGVGLLAQTVFDLGVSAFVLRERARDQESGLVTAALGINDRLSVLLGVVSFVVLLGMGRWVTNDAYALLPLAIWVGAERNASTWLSVAYSDGDWRVNLSNLVVKRVLAIVFFVGLVALSMQPLLAFSLSWAVSSQIAAVGARRFVVPMLPEPQTLELRALLQHSWPYWKHSMATQAKNLDVGLVGMAAGSYQAGIFSVASRLTSPLRLLPTSMATALLPAATKSSSSGDRSRLYRIAILVTLAMSVVYVVMFVCAPFVVPRVLGESYTPSIKALEIVLAGLPFAAGASMFGTILQGTGDKHFVANVSLGVALGYLVLVPLVTASFGASGGAAVLSLSFVVQCVLYVTRPLRHRWTSDSDVTRRTSRAAFQEEP